MGIKVAQKWDFLSFSLFILCFCMFVQIYSCIFVSRAYSFVYLQWEMTFVESSFSIQQWYDWAHPYFSSVSWTNWQIALWAESLVQIDYECAYMCMCVCCICLRMKSEHQISKVNVCFSAAWLITLLSLSLSFSPSACLCLRICICMRIPKHGFLYDK